MAPHLDDECWCGALLAREQDASIRIVALSSYGYRSVDDATILVENQQSVALVGAGVEYLDNPPYYFDRGKICDDLYRAVSEYDPDLVLIPASTDYHQDHEIAHAEAVRVLHHRNCDILGYLVPGNGAPQPAHRAVVSPEHLAVKQAMINCYQSQAYRGRTSAGIEERYEVVRLRL